MNEKYGFMHSLPSEYEFVEETNDSYIIKNDKGVLLTLYKIDTKIIKQNFYNEVEKAANALEKVEVIDLLEKIKVLITQPPSVVEYYNIAKGIVETLKGFYKKIGSPNIFHHLIKDIDPETYGKAQKFLNDIEQLKNILEEIISVK